MPTNDTVTVHTCVKEYASKYAILLALITCPINSMMLKILVKRLTLRRPRHMILLSLSVSDNVQILLPALLHLLSLVLKLETTSIVCQIGRKTVEIGGTVTFFTSSASILGLSFERYVACVHCFRVDQLITEKLVKRAVLGAFLTAVIVAFGDPQTYKASLTPEILDFSIPRRMVFSISVILTTVILLWVQIRLYLLSRAKTKVHASTGTSTKAEAIIMRRRQLKITISASAVVGLFMICMLPLSCYDLINGFVDDAKSNTKLALLLLAMLNTLADPFVYGFGMTDTRQAIIKEFKAIISVCDCRSNRIGTQRNKIQPSMTLTSFMQQK